MSSLIRTLSIAALACLLGSAIAAEEKKADKKSDPFAQVFTFDKKITATDEQKAKMADLKKEYTPKLEEISKKASAIMTAEREKEAAAEVRKKVAADGKKGKEVGEAVDAALKLSKEEQDQLKDLNKSRVTLMAEINKKKMDLLTVEQKEALKPKKPAEKK